MSKRITLGEDVGFITVVLPGGEEKTLDLWEVRNAVSDYYQKNKAGLVELLQTFGLPPLSHMHATLLVTEVQKAVEEVRRRFFDTPGSPASTT